MREFLTERFKLSFDLTSVIPCSSPISYAVETARDLSCGRVSAKDGAGQEESVERRICMKVEEVEKSQSRYYLAMRDALGGRRASCQMAL